MSTFWPALIYIAMIIAFSNSARANEPIVVLSANALKFGAQAQGTASAPQRILIANTGTADLVITSISLAGENAGDFSETHSCPAAPAAVTAGAHCEIQIIFKPKTIGDLSANINISDNGSGSPRSVSLSGHSGQPVPQVTLSPVTLAFGNQALGSSSKVQTVVLSNTGSATLNINTSITIAGTGSSEFHLQRASGACPEGTGQLAAETSCSINVVFAPVSAGPKSAQVLVVNDAAGSPQTVALSGVGSGT